MMRLIGIALLAMFALGLFFQVTGVFVWFLLGWGAIAFLLSFRLQEEM